jgi:hypothetical protein
VGCVGVVQEISPKSELWGGLIAVSECVKKYTHNNRFCVVIVFSNAFLFTLYVRVRRARVIDAGVTHARFAPVVHPSCRGTGRNTSSNRFAAGLERRVPRDERRNRLALYLPLRIVLAEVCPG